MSFYIIEPFSSHSIAVVLLVISYARAVSWITIPQPVCVQCFVPEGTDRETGGGGRKIPFLFVG